MWFTGLWDLDHQVVQWLVVVSATVICTITDVRSRRIPNLVTLPLLIGGLVHAAAAVGWRGVADGVTAAVLLALPYVILYALARGGAGDAKLMAAIGAWLGVINGFAVLFAVAIFGVILSPLFAMWSSQCRQAQAIAVGELSLVSGIDRVNLIRRTRVPYGLAICAGVCTAAEGVLLWPG